MEKRKKESEKEKELQKNIILCTLIFITATIALPMLLWKMDFSKQGVGAVVAVFILIDFVFLFSLIGVFDETIPQESDNIAQNTISEVSPSQQDVSIYLTSAELEEILLIVKSDTNYGKIQTVRNTLFLCYNKKYTNKKK